MRLQTELLHCGYDPTKFGGAFAVPICRTTAFLLPEPSETAKLFSLEELGPLYARTSNPTTDVLEHRLAKVEGGRYAVTFASGKAAIVAAIVALARAGDNIVAARHLYAGTATMFRSLLPDLGIEVRFVDEDTPDAFVRAADDHTRAFYAETLANPALSVLDLPAVAALSRSLGVPLVVDNTLAVGLCQPLVEGAALTVLSCSKYASGNGSVLMGAVIEGNFDWSASAKRFPRLYSPDMSYGGLVWADAAARHGLSPFILRLRYTMLRDLGATASPFAAVVVLQGLETLTMRMDLHSRNAATLASHLAHRLGPDRVYYPGLPTSPYYERAKRLLPQGCGGMVSFDLTNAEAGQRFIKALSIFRHVASNGDARSLAIHPASTMLRQLTPAAQAETGVSEGYVRLSVGLEAIEDLIDDVDRALATVLL